MKKLLIPFFFLAAAVTAHAHCGACGTGDAAHAQPKAEKDASKKVALDKTDKMAVCTDMSACKEKCDGKAACSGKEASYGDKKSNSDASVEAKAPADKVKAKATTEPPMPKMACCAAES